MIGLTMSHKGVSLAKIANNLDIKATGEARGASTRVVLAKFVITLFVGMDTLCCGAKCKLKL